MYKLIARRRDNNQDEFLKEFYDSRQFYYMLDQVDQEIYKEASILEYKDNSVFPELKMYVEFKENVLCKSCKQYKRKLKK